MPIHRDEEEGISIVYIQDKTGRLWIVDIYLRHRLHHPRNKRKKKRVISAGMKALRIKLGIEDPSEIPKVYGYLSQKIAEGRGRE